jgi:hypothetical protein
MRMLILVKAACSVPVVAGINMWQVGRCWDGRSMGWLSVIVYHAIGSNVSYSRQNRLALFRDACASVAIIVRLIMHVCDKVEHGENGQRQSCGQYMPQCSLWETATKLSNYISIARCLTLLSTAKPEPSIPLSLSLMQYRSGLFDRTVCDAWCVGYILSVCDPGNMASDRVWFEIIQLIWLSTGGIENVWTTEATAHAWCVFSVSFYRKTSLKKTFCRYCDDLSVFVCYSVCLSVCLSHREPFE